MASNVRVLIVPAAAASLALVLGLAPFSAAVKAADAERGGRLYETRCNACHTSSAHNRSTRKAKSFDGIRAQVARWVAEVGGNWEESDIDDLTLHLNQRYYRFPCPASACKANQAALAR